MGTYDNFFGHQEIYLHKILVTVTLINETHNTDNE
jgi:hypothetical protein